MLEALIAGERDPGVLAGLARGRMTAEHAAVAEALTGRLGDHHAELARMLLDQVGAGESEDAAARSAIGRLDEIPGVSRHAARVILAEAGLDMTRFPAAGHLVSRATLSPRAIQSGTKSKSGKNGQGSPYLKGALGEAAAAAARTDTFPGARCRRIVRRRGKLRVLVAVARSNLVIIWQLLARPAACYRELGAGHYASRTDTGRRARSHVRQLEASRIHGDSRHRAAPLRAFRGARSAVRSGSLTMK